MGIRRFGLTRSSVAPLANQQACREKSMQSPVKTQPPASLLNGSRAALFFLSLFLLQLPLVNVACLLMPLSERGRFRDRPELETTSVSTPAYYGRSQRNCRSSLLESGPSTIHATLIPSSMDVLLFKGSEERSVAAVRAPDAVPVQVKEKPPSAASSLERYYTTPRGCAARSQALREPSSLSFICSSPRGHVEQNKALLKARISHRSCWGRDGAFAGEPVQKPLFTGSPRGTPFRLSSRHSPLLFRVEDAAPGRICHAARYAFDGGSNFYGASAGGNSRLTLSERSINKVNLLGRVGNDPDVRVMPSGERVANFNLATSESWKDKATGELRNRTEWHRVVVYDQSLCETAEKFIRKGRRLYLEGTLQTRRWVSGDGQERFTTEVVIPRYRGEVVLLENSESKQQSQGTVDDMGEASHVVHSPVANSMSSSNISRSPFTSRTYSSSSSNTSSGMPERRGFAQPQRGAMNSRVDAYGGAVTGQPQPHLSSPGSGIRDGVGGSLTPSSPPSATGKIDGRRGIVSNGGGGN